MAALLPSKVNPYKIF